MTALTRSLQTPHLTSKLFAQAARTTCLRHLLAAPVPSSLLIRARRTYSSRKAFQDAAQDTPATDSAQSQSQSQPNSSSTLPTATTTTPPPQSVVETLTSQSSTTSKSSTPSSTTPIHPPTSTTGLNNSINLSLLSGSFINLPPTPRREIDTDDVVAATKCEPRPPRAPRNGPAPITIPAPAATPEKAEPKEPTPGALRWSPPTAPKLPPVKEMTSFFDELDQRRETRMEHSMAKVEGTKKAKTGEEWKLRSSEKKVKKADSEPGGRGDGREMSPGFRDGLAEGYKARDSPRFEKYGSERGDKRGVWDGGERGRSFRAGSAEGYKPRDGPKFNSQRDGRYGARGNTGYGSPKFDGQRGERYGPGRNTGYDRPKFDGQRSGRYGERGNVGYDSQRGPKFSTRERYSFGGQKSDTMQRGSTFGSSIRPRSGQRSSGYGSRSYYSTMAAPPTKVGASALNELGSKEGQESFGRRKTSTKEKLKAIQTLTQMLRAELKDLYALEATSSTTEHKSLATTRVVSKSNSTAQGKATDRANIEAKAREAKLKQLQRKLTYLSAQSSKLSKQLYRTPSLWKPNLTPGKRALTRMAKSLGTWNRSQSRYLSLTQIIWPKRPKVLLPPQEVSKQSEISISPPKQVKKGRKVPSKRIWNTVQYIPRGAPKVWRTVAVTESSKESPPPLNYRTQYDPIYVYFRMYFRKFDFNPHAKYMSEFRRLWRWSGWHKSRGNITKYKEIIKKASADPSANPEELNKLKYHLVQWQNNLTFSLFARRLFRAAMVKAFRRDIGGPLTDNIGWQKLCDQAGVEFIWNNPTQCAKNIASKYVTLVDLHEEYRINAPTPCPIVFDNHTDYERYSRENHKFFEPSLLSRSAVNIPLKEPPSEILLLLIKTCLERDSKSLWEKKVRKIHHDRLTVRRGGHEVSVPLAKKTVSRLWNGKPKYHLYEQQDGVKIMRVAA